MRPTSRTLLVLALALSVAMVLTGCAPGANPMVHHAVDGRVPAGFFLGIWHGVIVVLTFIVSLFDGRVSVYEVYNNGWPYNLGFVIGAVGLHGGGASASRRRRRRDVGAV